MELAEIQQYRREELPKLFRVNTLSFLLSHLLVPSTPTWDSQARHPVYSDEVDYRKPESLRIQWFHKYAFLDQRNPAMWVVPRRAGATTIASAIALFAAREIAGSQTILVLRNHEDMDRTHSYINRLAGLNGMSDVLLDATHEWINCCDGARIVFTCMAGLSEAVRGHNFDLALFDVPSIWSVEFGDEVERMVHHGTIIKIILGASPVGVL